MNETVVRSEDVLPVRSRVSWGAIFAGAIVALALYSLLTLLGAAIGMSMPERVNASNLGTGAAIYAIIATVLSLFVGGYVTSQCTVGENRFESVLYGVITWGVLFAMLLSLMASGLSAGFHAMVGMAQVSQAATGDNSGRDWEATARKAGVSQEQIDEWRRKTPTAEDARRKMDDPQTRQDLAEGTTRAAWYAFFGTLFSMLASVTGSVMGAGPRFAITRVRMLHQPYEVRQPAARV